MKKIDDWVKEMSELPEVSSRHWVYH